MDPLFNCTEKYMIFNFKTKWDKWVDGVKWEKCVSWNERDEDTFG